MKDIKDALPKETFSCAEKRSRAKLEEAVCQLPETHLALLEHAARTKKKPKERSREKSSRSRTAMKKDRQVLQYNPFLQCVSDKC
jgi:hypothetical protein